MVRRSSLCLSPSCQTLSKALETSRRTTFELCLCCCALDMVSWKMARAVCVPRHPLNPCWLSLWRSCSVRWWLRRVFRILSRILPWISKREMGL